MEHNLKSKITLNIMSEKIYNAIFYSVLEYIHQLSMLSHVKYRNSNFSRVEKSKYYLGTRMLKTKLL